MDDILKNLIKQFMPFAQKNIGFTSPPKLFLKKDSQNAKNPLGKTAYYEPSSKSIYLYVSERHPKDILRSLGHELVHHKQNCDGKFDDDYDMGPGYAQKDPHLRQMEQEANRDGSMCLRDFEDMLKKQNTIYYEHLQKGDNKMSIKNWKNEELKTILAEAWGFKFNTLEEFEKFDGSGELQAESDDESTEMNEEELEESTEEELEESTDEEIEEGKVPPGLAAHQAKQKSKKDDKDDDEEEDKDKPSSGDSKKMPMEDEPEGKDLNKDGKKGHGKVPAFLKEDPEELQEAIEALLRKHLRG